MTRALYEQYTRDEVYMLVLLKACEIEPPAGGAAYPYRVIRELVWIQEERVEADVLVPLRTTNRSNKEMMTACFAAELLAAEWDIGPLPETYEEYGVPV